MPQFLGATISFFDQKVQPLAEKVFDELIFSSRKTVNKNLFLKNVRAVVEIGVVVFRCLTVIIIKSKLEKIINHLNVIPRILFMR